MFKRAYLPILACSLAGFGCTTVPPASTPAPEVPPAWDKAIHASCWNGANASQRMMNMLSPYMSDSKFDKYLAWMQSRGCDTAHVFLSNIADGETAKPGYSVYGPTCDWTVDPAMVTKMKSRIDKLRKAKLAYVPWLFADDSSAFNAKAKSNFPKYLADLKAQGLLDSASTVVVGLELDEYYSAGDVSKLVAATRAVYSGKIGTHQKSGNYAYSKFADICFYQIKPGASAATIKAEAARVRAKSGRPVNFFELERSPARSKCEAALAGGAYGVGNW